MGGPAGLSPLALTEHEEQLLAGTGGPAVALAMQVVTALARATGAARLVEISGAHIDSCLYHGPVSLGFARRLRDLGGQVAVPTTLNVGSEDLLHPGAVRTDPTHPSARAEGAELMRVYQELGGRATFTCAPYLRDARPALGEHVAWAESNAIAFANSVLGARTERYGDFMDICAALTARVPDTGLHRTENRAATVVVDVTGVRGLQVPDEITIVGLGALVGRLSGEIAAITGLPADLPEDRLKALCSAGATTGSLALVHVVGRTPEAATLEEATQGRPPRRVLTVTEADLATEVDRLSSAAPGPVDAVCLGTPHASLAELGEIAALMGEDRVRPGLHAWVNTNRAAYAIARQSGMLERLDRAGWRVLTDTCTYITPVLPPEVRVAATSSGKWAAYAPSNIGVDTVLGTTAECVAAAKTGILVRQADPHAGEDR